MNTITKVEKLPEAKVTYTLEDIKQMLFTANKKIVARTSYFCGIERLDLVKDKHGNDMYSGFFLSPDYQNGDLYYELINLKMLNAGYKAPYYWKVRKGGYMITYTEGDIVIYEIKKVNCPVCDKPFKNGTCVECDKMVDSLKIK